MAVGVLISSNRPSDAQALIAKLPRSLIEGGAAFSIEATD